MEKLREKARYKIANGCLGVYWDTTEKNMNRLLEITKGNSIIIVYDTQRYPFQKVLAKYVYKIPHLNQLHKVWKKQIGKHVLAYQDNLILRKLMQKLPDTSLFYQVFHKWVAGILAPHYGKISYSAHPKMRVHLAGTGCVSGFHRDVDVTGRLDQINCYLPFTDVYDTSTLWSETDYGSEDYYPLNLKYSQALLWDGGLLKHGTYHNKTDNTRISCDFRFCPKNIELVKSPWRNVLGALEHRDVSPEVDGSLKPSAWCK